MATPAHCLYCFETLAAHLQKREALTLEEVEKYHHDYVRTPAPSQTTQPKRLPALRRLVAGGSSSESSASNSSSTLSLAESTTPATSVSSLPSDEEPEPAVTESPLFVTWNTVSPRHGLSLRGCIGTFEAQDIDEGLSDYALTSALRDTRFPPISARELPNLAVGVTLLTDFEDAGGPEDWELGKHGIRISFTSHGRRYGATYLPDVAPEQGWDKEETILSLMRKAGWSGDKKRWREVEMKVVRYQGKKMDMEFGEYKTWREWVDEREA